MTEKLPPPPVPPTADLNGYEFMPLFGERLRTSSHNTRASDAEFRASVNLWWSAWVQVPAASLPDNEAELCKLADLGREKKAWSKVRAIAMRNFVMCSDGRYYHKFLAPKALKAWAERLEVRWCSECGRLKKKAQREKKKPEYPPFALWINREHPESVPFLSLETVAFVPGDTPPPSPETGTNVPGETLIKGEERREKENLNPTLSKVEAPEEPPTPTAKASGEKPHVNPDALARIVAECVRAKVEDATTENAVIQRWHTQGATPSQVTAALVEARKPGSKPEPEVLRVGYVDTILVGIIQADAKARAAVERRAHATDELIANSRANIETTAPMPPHLRPKRKQAA